MYKRSRDILKKCSGLFVCDTGNCGTDIVLFYSKMKNMSRKYHRKKRKSAWNAENSMDFPGKNAAHRCRNLDRRYGECYNILKEPETTEAKQMEASIKGKKSKRKEI